MGSAHIASSRKPAPRPAQRAAAASVAAEPLPRARVLVVDDDEHNLLAIRTVIEDLAEVETAASGEEALRHLLKGEFAVILLDVFMTGMDGYETAQIIRAREQTKRIPIVFLSAVNKEKEHLLRGYAMGAVDYVFKPVEPVVLRSKVGVFVDLFTMRHEIERKAAQEQQLLDANLRANAERLEIEQALRLAEQRQAAIISSLPIVLYLEEGGEGPRVPQFVGGNFEALTGFPFEAAQETPSLWADRLHPDDRERAFAALAARQQTGAMAVEYRWRCADGQYKHFLDQAVLLAAANGAARQYAGTLLDVTDRKALEEELLQTRKMEAIGKLTGGIAHDFNNLLAAVLGGIGLIERRLELDAEQRRIVGMTRHAAEQGAELVGRLLAFARRQKLQPGPIDLSRLSASVTELLAPTLGGLVRLEWQSEEGVWPVYADSAQLELALMNLIINARDAMPDGGTVLLTARNAAAQPGNAVKVAPGDYVVLAVNDSGSGIAPDLLAQVTEPFFTTKDVGKGTGLGLSMVYGFASQSGGGIRIDSTLGEGTIVELWLPRAAEAEQVAEAAPSRPEAMAAGKSLRILLVDDHAAVRETTEAILRDLGHDVETACDGPAMLRRLADAPADCDLIITDYAMPLMSGCEMLKQARGILPAVPAILISGYADDQALADAPAGVTILRKPFTLGQMGEAISTLTADI
jgi:signal transduction histidine kinase/two-component SAPR family response regulator